MMIMTFNEIKEKLRNHSVGIAGCGGLGSNAAVALARVGIGKLIIADFDRIEESNLNRQYYFQNQVGKFKTTALKQNLTSITPDIIVEDHNIMLESDDIVELFAECDAVIEAFDKAEMKEIIIETIQSNFPEKPIISGVGIAGWGGNELIKTRKLGNLYIIGDGESEVDNNNPPLAPRVGIVSNMMANIVLEILLKQD